MENFINFDKESECNKPICRIFSVARLLSIIKSNSLTLVRPKKWDAPFENFILRASASVYSSREMWHDSSNLVYGQCWSEHFETDAMWRIYSPLKDGVKISTTAFKLRSALAQEVSNESQMAFIGKVDYLSQKKLAELIETAWSFNTSKLNGFSRAETLLYKRVEFKHEKEVRLIYCAPEDSPDNDIFSFKIDPITLIDSIIFDPRMDREVAEVYMAYLKNAGFDCTIKQSTLYEIPQLSKKL